jgi:hypothetical protein
MDQKVITAALMAFICVLFISCAGCATMQERTPVPTTQSPTVTETHTTITTPVATPTVQSEATAVSTPLPSHETADRSGTSDPDAAFNVFYVKSTEEIVNKTGDVIEAMAIGSVVLQAAYSPAVLYLKAEDLGFTIDRSYVQTLTIKTNTPEGEEKRIAYLQFLVPARSAAYHIADAAAAESDGDYEYALSMARAAKGDLWYIEANPDLPPTSYYNTLNIFLSEYIGRLSDKVIQQQQTRH